MRAVQSLPPGWRVLKFSGVEWCGLQLRDDCNDVRLTLPLLPRNPARWLRQPLTGAEVQQALRTYYKLIGEQHAGKQLALSLKG